MNLVEILIIAVLAVAVFFALRRMIRMRKSGGCGPGGCGVFCAAPHDQNAEKRRLRLRLCRLRKSLYRSAQKVKTGYLRFLHSRSSLVPVGGSAVLSRESIKRVKVFRFLSIL